MTDFSDRPPVEQRQIVERSSTLQDLFDGEHRGQKAEFKADVIPELSQHTAAFETAWKQNFNSLKTALGESPIYRPGGASYTFRRSP